MKAQESIPCVIKSTRSQAKTRIYSITYLTVQPGHKVVKDVKTSFGIRVLHHLMSATV